MVKNTTWTSTAIPTDLSERIEIFVNNKEGKKLGFTSRTGFIADVLREKLDELDGKSKKQQTKIENKISDMQKDLNIQLENVANRLQKEIMANSLEKELIEFSRLENSCPTCRQEITENHHRDLIITKRKELERILGNNDPVILNDDIKKQKKKKIAFIPPYLPKIELMEKEKDRFVLMDHTKERIANVAITNGKYFCNLCEEENCVHVGFVFSLPDASEKLEKKLTKTA